MSYFETTTIAHALENGKVVTVKIVINSHLRPFLHWQSMQAITIWNTIHVAESNISDQGVTHELTHVTQWHRYGFFGFLWRYFSEQIRHGYQKNALEQEARKRSGEGER